jgi:nucleoside-diphosphate-sugar epimerase
MKKVLILGNRSFVATGLYELFKQSQLDVTCFSRGSEGREGDFIKGDVFQMQQNRFLGDAYDTVINFILIKDGNLQDNIAYIDSVIKLCKRKGVKHLVHFSSIMVYENGAKYIDEQTAIEGKTMKRGYGYIKIEVDRYLAALKDLPFSITFVRPGYVLAEDRPCPFIKRLPFGISMILGDKKSIQPIVKREDIHRALLHMVRGNFFDPVFLFTPDKSISKYAYAKQAFGGVVLGLPRGLILGAAGLLKSMGVVKSELFVRVEGMYIRSVYNSAFTQSRLNIKF